MQRWEELTTPTAAHLAVKSPPTCDGLDLRALCKFSTSTRCKFMVSLCAFFDFASKHLLHNRTIQLPSHDIPVLHIRPALQLHLRPAVLGPRKHKQEQWSGSAEVIVWYPLLVENYMWKARGRQPTQTVQHRRLSFTLLRTGFHLQVRVSERCPRWQPSAGVVYPLQQILCRNCGFKRSLPRGVRHRVYSQLWFCHWVWWVLEKYCLATTTVLTVLSIASQFHSAWHHRCTTVAPWQLHKTPTHWKGVTRHPRVIHGGALEWGHQARFQ